MRKLICDYFQCKEQATHRLVMINAMAARIGQVRAYVLCDEHAAKNDNVFNYRLSKIED